MLVALLVTVALLLACGPASVPAQDSNDLATVSGVVTAQGRSDSRGITVEVYRIGSSAQPQLRAEVVAQGLETPWALDFAPGGRIFVTERPGRIRLVQDGVLMDRPLATLEVARVSEAGLMGLALDPEFPDNGYIYVCYTYWSSDGSLKNRVSRLAGPWDASASVEERVLLDGIPGARNHNGCRLGFGPGGMLYATTGDAQDPRSAQDPNSLAGKVLRMDPRKDPNRNPPPDNPFPGSYVYTLGHRNPQGMDWRPETGELFITEHGPRRDDEINVLRPGGNYGWPDTLGRAGEPGYVDPVLTFTPTVALAGGAFYTGDLLPATWRGSFVFANLKGSHLRRLGLDPSDPRRVVEQQRLFQDEFGRLRAVAMGPDGYLYFTTSNRDGRGDPAPADDRLLRLIVEEPQAEMEAAVASSSVDAAGYFQLALAPGGYRLRFSLSGLPDAEVLVEVARGQENVDVGVVEMPRENPGSSDNSDGTGAVDQQGQARRTDANVPADGLGRTESVGVDASSGEDLKEPGSKALCPKRNEKQ